MTSVRERASKPRRRTAPLLVTTALLMALFGAVSEGQPAGAAGPVSSITVLTRPAVGLAGRPLYPALQVKTLDSVGTPVVAPGTVTVTLIPPASGGAALRLTGTTSVTPASATVTFSNLVLSAPASVDLRVTATGTGVSTTVHVTTIGQKITTPAYFRPGTNWTTLGAAAPGATDLAVMNPASGPGTTVDSAYTSQLSATHARGVTVVGYVYADYGARSLATVKADIARWFGLYAVDGIFIDLTESACTHVASYYKPLYDYIRTFTASAGRTMAVIINPGVQVPECFAAASDIIVNFEGYYTDYVASYTQPTWVSAYSPARFWHIIHDATTTTQLYEAVRLSKLRRAGHVFVTDEGQTPTAPDVYLYDRMPKAAIWTPEVLAVSLRPTSAPTGLTVTPGATAGSVSASWTAPALNRGSAVTGYTLTAYSGTTAVKSFVFASTATTRTATGLTSGAHLTFRVTAYNANGSGPASVATTAVTIP